MEKELKLSCELDIEITALANQTRCHPNTILNALMNCGHETVRIHAYSLRENYDSMQPGASKHPAQSTTHREPRAEHWRQALRIEPIPFTPPNCNQQTRSITRLEGDSKLELKVKNQFQNWEFSKDKPTWIKTDKVDAENAHWYLVNKAYDSSDHESIAIEIKPNAVSLVNFLAFMPDWVNKAQVLTALTPALIAVSLGAEFTIDQSTY